MDLGHILIVDDSESVRLALAECLRFHGYNVACAEGVQEALERLRSLAPDVVLADLCLADGSGLAVLQQARKMPGSRSSFCILMTGFASMESAVEAVRSGIDDYLAKPVDMGELTALVSAGVARARARRGEAMDPEGRHALLDELNQPLSALRAYLDLLGEGRFGPLTSVQEEKIALARSSLGKVFEVIRERPAKADPPQAPTTVAPRMLTALVQELHDAWAPDFERCGAQVAWSFPKQGDPLAFRPEALVAQLERRLADWLSHAGFGTTLRLDWKDDGHALNLRLALEAGTAATLGRESVLARGALAVAPSNELKALDLRLPYAATA